MVRALIAALCIFTLAGCIDSTKPIQTDAKPLLGANLRLQFYGLHKGFAEEPEQADYVWSGTQYAHTAGGMTDTAAFTVHPFEAGNYIIQSVSADPKRKIEYALMRELAPGVYLVTVIDEHDADEAVRAANCHTIDDYTCRIENQAQLFTLARATAARSKDDGGLGVRLRRDKN